jgi:hypothetical protein
VIAINIWKCVFRERVIEYLAMVGNYMKVRDELQQDK